MDLKNTSDWCTCWCGFKKYFLFDASVGVDLENTSDWCTCWCGFKKYFLIGASVGVDLENTSYLMQVFE